MRRAALRPPVVRAITTQARRGFVQSTTRSRPDLATNASEGTTSAHIRVETAPFRFETGLALFAKRPSRPFPPPFLSPPSGSFSDPLSTHNRSRDRRAFVNGELILGHTNGDDAVYASDVFIAANDGVGAWSTRPGGHAGLWSRLILHFWAAEIESESRKLTIGGKINEPTPIAYLQKAYEQTVQATSEPNEWQGTTTAAGAQLHFQRSSSEPTAPATPILYVTNLGDCQILVIRPRDSTVVFKTIEQWHWFDCPRQLGTNSPDTPRDNAVVDRIEIEENDVVLAMSDGVIDNLWEHEIVTNVVESIQKWEASAEGPDLGDRKGGAGGGMQFVADRLMNAARVIAQDPFAESPFMEHAVEEGLAMEGGQWNRFTPLNGIDFDKENSMTLALSLLFAEVTKGEHQRCLLDLSSSSTLLWRRGHWLTPQILRALKNRNVFGSTSSFGESSTGSKVMDCIKTITEPLLLD